MQRWFFANEREECQRKKASANAVSDDETTKEPPQPEIVYTQWPFCVQMSKPLHGNEHVAITGNCDSLGNWDPKQVYLMEGSGCECATLCQCTKFEAQVLIPRNVDIEYRYCIVGHDPLLGDMIIRFWEVMHRPRIIGRCHNQLKSCDRFGLHNDAREDRKQIDRGWATTETYIQLRIFNAPFIWLKQAPRLLYTYVQPMYETQKILCPVRELLGYTQMVTAHRPMSTLSTPGKLQLAFTEVTNLCSAEKMTYQQERGARCGPEDLQVFHLTIRNPEETSYRLDLYTFAHKKAYDEPPYHYGYGFVQPEQLRGSEGQLRIKINCASTHRPLIEMTLRYLVIQPMPANTFNMHVSYERYWREKHQTLDIGHRGSGCTYRFGGHVHRENTIFGFRRASHHTDMIELDVQLTRDAQVVVYHDYALRFLVGSTASRVLDLLPNYDVMIMPHERFTRLRLMALGGTKRGGVITVPVQAFDYDELRLAQPLQYVGRSSCERASDRYLLDQHPFPLLSEVFDTVPGHVGLYIELKWPQQDANGRWQDQSSKPSRDRNFYVDTVLAVVFQLAGKRRIIFASFDADICIMVRFKQNRYPCTLLLSNPQVVPFRDRRVNRFEHAAHLAVTMQLLGLSVHASTLSALPLILGLIRELQLQAITWGTPNNDLSHRERVRRFGLVGIVFDRIDQKDQAGDEMQGYLYCVDTPASRASIQALVDNEKQLKMG